MSFSRKRTKLHTVICACGRTFITATANVKNCVPCRELEPWKTPTQESRSCRFFGEKRKEKYTPRRPTDYLDRLRRYGIEPGHTVAQWHAVLRAQDFRCFYCGVDLEIHTWSRDHKIPLSHKGTSDDISNIVACCRSCNSRKGTMTSEEFINKSLRKKKEGIKGQPLFSQPMTMASLSTTKHESLDIHREARKSVQREVARFETFANIPEDVDNL